MKMVSRIEEAVAWVRLKNGVFKQTELYHRGTMVLLKHGQGYVRVAAKAFDEYWPTSHPDIKVLEMDVPTEAGSIVQDKFALTYKANQ